MAQPTSARGTVTDSLIHVITIARSSHGLRLAVMGRSMFDHLGAGETIEFTIIHDGLPRDVQDRLRASWDVRDSVLRFVPFRPGILPLPERIAAPALECARLDAGPYVTSGCERAVFLDADTVVMSDLARLWRQPLGGRVALATRDPFIPTVSHSDGIAGWRQMGLDAAAPYLSCAVILVDLAAWRREGITARALEYLERFGRALRFGEQDAINVALAGQWGPLDPRWQVQPRSLSRRRLSGGLTTTERLQCESDPWVYHFGGRLKPWDYRGRTPGDAAFFRYLDQTQWSGYRPPLSLKSLFFTLYDSPVRDWVHPLELAWSRLLRPKP